MTLPIVVQFPAREEFDSALDWYESQQSGLGTRFAAAVQNVFDRLAKNPLIHGLVSRNVRCELVPGFPYGVYYCVQPARVTVIAIYHSSRDPSGWRSRKPE